MTKKDFQKFLSPIRKRPATHESARPVGFSERTFYNSDKRYFTGIQKEVLCAPDSADRQFSNEITGPAPAAQFYCDDTTKNQLSIRYFFDGYNIADSYAEIPVTIYDNLQYCSSWATAVTSAMSLTLSRWSKTTVNLSIQFLLDCDILGDPCLDRPPLSAYEQFWRRYIPQAGKWRSTDNPLTPPSRQLTEDICSNYKACYPGETSCQRNLVLSGVCEEGIDSGSCPIYLLYNWYWIKSHLAEVGAVTSSILARAALFTYSSGVYSSWGTSESDSAAWSTDNIATPTSSEDKRSDVLGMLDVTIIGWGQKRVNMTNDNIALKERWWYVIPHLGLNYGLKCPELFESITAETSGIDLDDAYKTGGNIQNLDFYDLNAKKTINGFVFILGQNSNERCGTADFSNSEKSEQRTGIIKFNRKFDDSYIESNAVGAVPFNFVPKPQKTLTPIPLPTKTPLPTLTPLPPASTLPTATPLATATQVPYTHYWDDSFSNSILFSISVYQSLTMTISFRMASVVSNYYSDGQQTYGTVLSLAPIPIFIIVTRYMEFERNTQFLYSLPKASLAIIPIIVAAVLIFCLLNSFLALILKCRLEAVTSDGSQNNNDDNGEIVNDPENPEDDILEINLYSDESQASMSDSFLF